MLGDIRLKINMGSIDTTWMKIFRYRQKYFNVMTKCIVFVADRDKNDIVPWYFHGTIFMGNMCMYHFWINFLLK